MNFNIFPPTENMTLDNINHFIRNIRENGEEPEGIVIHHRQFYDLSNLLSSQQRYMEIVNVLGAQLCSFQGIPIYPVSFSEGYQCKVCGYGASKAFFNINQKIVFCCKEHRDRAQMFIKMEGI